MKKLLLLLGVILLMATGAKADIVEIDGLNYEIDKAAGTAALTFGGTVIQNSETAFAGKSYGFENVVIPSSFIYEGKEYIVNEIRGGAFYGSDNLKNITINENITKIGIRAFYNCTSLTSVRLPETLEEIGSYGFSNCSSLISITLPESLNILGSYAFYECEKLEGITIPENITAIEPYTFYYCRALTYVNFPENLKTIGDRAFTHADGLTLVKLPESVISLGKGCFGGCINLQHVNLNEKLETVDQVCFSNCASLEEIEFPENVELDLYELFLSCGNLKYVRLPKKLKSTSGENTADGGPLNTRYNYQGFFKSCFSGCINLERVEFHPDTQLITSGGGYKAIGENAFYNCTKLKEINLPKGFKTIERNAFQNCGVEYIDNLESIIHYNSNSFYNSKLKDLYFPSLEASKFYWNFDISFTNLKTAFLGKDVPSQFFNYSKFSNKPIEKLIVLRDVPFNIITSSQLDETKRYGILYVPAEAVETYKVTDWWMGFRDIRPYIYMADLELTSKTLKVQEGGTLQITPVYENDATYPSFDWSTDNYNATSVTREGVVTGLKAGEEATITARALDLSGESATIDIRVVSYNPIDPNGDGRTTVADALGVAMKALLGDNDDLYDIDGNGKVDIDDVLAIIDAILDAYQPGKANVRAANDATANDLLVAENFNIEKNGQAVVPVRLEGLSKYAALQADVTVDGGISIDDITIGARASFSHSISTRKIDDNTVRVVLFSAMAEAFADNDEPLFNIAISGNEAKNASIMISNIIAAEDGENEAVLGYKGGVQNVVTGIDGVEGAATVYTEAGRIVVANAAGCNVAIYNVNGEMVENTVAGSNPAVFPVNTGIYVVTVDGTNYKVIVK